MSYPFQLTFDCHDIETMARFWTVALSYDLQEPPEGFSSWADFATNQGIPEELWRVALVDPAGKGPRLFFQPVPEGKRRRTGYIWTSASARAAGHSGRDADLPSPTPIAVWRHADGLDAAMRKNVRRKERWFRLALVERLLAGESAPFLAVQAALARGIE